MPNYLEDGTVSGVYGEGYGLMKATKAAAAGVHAAPPVREPLVDLDAETLNALNDARKARNQVMFQGG